ncbi:MAG: ABC transporter permease [Cyclobacteriaceae bacterium]|nr:ABC transporter permease [Cyclobacteriaceae bacterium]
MLTNYLLITWRSMMKNKLFILINMLGMGVAIAQCIVGFFAYEYDALFDSQHAHREHIYRVSSIRNFEGQLTRHGRAPLPLGDIVDKTFPDVHQSSRYFGSYSNFKLDDNLFPANLTYVDPEFFQIFSFDFISGRPEALADKTSVFISESMAIRLFGSVDSSEGKTITQVYGTEVKEINVAGVFKDPPMNTSFYGWNGSAYLNFENYKDEHKSTREDDWAAMNTLFVHIPEDNRVSQVYRQLQPFTANINKVREDFQVSEFVLDPFSTMAHRDRADQTPMSTWGAPPISAVIGSNVMAVMVLLLACFNLTNTSIALSSRRLKEIGIRKVMGSLRKQLIGQYIGESLLTCVLAAGLGLLLADFMIMGWNFMWGYFRLTPHYFDNPAFLIFLTGVVLFAGLVAGGYPAFYISKFEPVTILKGTQKFGGTNYFTRTLLGLQFSISVTAIVSAVGFLQNARYQRAYDLGFDARGSLIAWVNNQGEFDTYRNALQANPDVKSIAGARSGIFSNRVNDPIKHESRQLEVDIIEVGDQYLSTLDLKLVSGRDFHRDSETDRKESVIITEKVAREFGWDNALGKEIIWKDSTKLFVVGVVKDVYTQGVWRELDPMIIRFVWPEQYTQLAVSTDAAKVKEVNTFMEETWRKVFPNRLYNGQMLSQNTAQADEVNINIVYMFSFMAAITLLLSATGLFTLVSLNIIKRTKEIGVRKVMGASISHIFRIVNTEFAIILVLAAALGAWGGFAQSTLIMGSIWKYYQEPNTMTFVISVSALFALSAAAISYKVYKAATMNPVDSLKQE